MNNQTNEAATEYLRYPGYCPICEAEVIFRASGDWLRDRLTCESCINGSVPRERALALILNETIPDWRRKTIHECSPIGRGISRKVARECDRYLASQFYPGRELGTIIDGARNEDLQALTFRDNAFDVFLSLDVMEHVPDPEKAIKEIWRHLMPGGYMISTWPVRKHQVVGLERRAVFKEDGTVTHLKEPEIHGNPVNKDGALVTVDYGYDTHQLLAHWAPFDVRVYRFNDRRHGILGEFTEVFTCRKRTA
jgi:SAM-dependent methyltransferase